ncbi:MAG: FG-GAP repeat protein, partial [Myxococcales bacterium]|nr:FG-GAP repeat protein [Myxococcales bacterium]
MRIGQRLAWVLAAVAWFGCSSARTNGTGPKGTGGDSNIDSDSGSSTPGMDEDDSGVLPVGPIDPPTPGLYPLATPGFDKWDLWAISVAASGNTVVLGTPFESSGASGLNGDELDRSLKNSGAAYVFQWNGTEWSKVQYIKAEKPISEARFGERVALHGDVLTISEIKGNGTRGAVHVYRSGASGFAYEATLTASNGDLDDLFGYSVAVFGDAIVVGAPQEDSSSAGAPGSNDADAAGAVYVFRRTGGVWMEEQFVKLPVGVSSNAFFGRHLGFDGKHLMSGAFTKSSYNVRGLWLYEDMGAGFEFTSLMSFDSGDERQPLVDQLSGSAIDAPVALRGTVFASGMRRRDGSTGPENGSVLSYDLADPSIVEVGGAILEPLDYGEELNGDGILSSSEHFGRQIDMTSTHLLVSDHSASPSGMQAAGAAHLYTRTNGTWTLQTTLTEPAPAKGRRFGLAVDLSEDSNLAVIARY